MKSIDHIRQKVAQTLNLDPPDEVFRPALDKAMYKALRVTEAGQTLKISLDWLAMVVCDYIRGDMISLEWKNIIDYAVEELTNGRVSK